jgi:hypothetical protein
MPFGPGRDLEGCGCCDLDGMVTGRGIRGWCCGVGFCDERTLELGMLGARVALMPKEPTKGTSFSGLEERKGIIGEESIDLSTSQCSV